MIAQGTGARSVPLTLARGEDGTTIFKDRVDSQILVGGEFRSQFFGACWWTLAALAFPILAFPFLENAAAKRSNGANLSALCVCLAADALCAWLFVSPSFHNWTSWLGVGVMAFFALWYDLQILHLAHRRTEPIPSVGA